MYLNYLSFCLFLKISFSAESSNGTQISGLSNGNQQVQTSQKTIVQIINKCAHENKGECLECIKLHKETLIAECRCTSEVCCCCLDSNIAKSETSHLPCGCVDQEQCCCSECDLSTQESDCESEDRFECFYCTISLKDCAILDCTCTSSDELTCLECKKAYFELLKTLNLSQETLRTIFDPKVALPEFYSTKESECTLDGQCDILQYANLQNLKKLTLEQAIKETEGYEKALIIGATDTTPGIIQKVKYVTTTQTQLTNLFKDLKKESEQVIKYYDYYDVLTLIDKSIAHINDFFDTFTFNVSNNSMLIKKYIERVIPIFEKYDFLSNEIDCLFKRHYETLNKSKIDLIEEELTSMNKRIAYLKEQYDRYKVFRIRDYQYSNTMKFHKLTRLLKDLNNVRCKILFMKEEDIKRNAKCLKENFKKTVSKIFDNLCKCKEKERRILNFMFEVLEDIWVNTRKCIDKMESLKASVLEKPCSKVTLDE